MKGFNKQLFHEILGRYNSGKASKEEVRYLEAYYNLFENDPDFLNEDNETSVKASVKLKVDDQIDLYQDTTGQGLSKKRSRFIVSYPHYALAAVLLITLSVSTYFLLKRNSNPVAALAIPEDHSPGGNQAILTLASGKRIVLDKNAKGEIAKQQGISIANTPDGQLIYTVMAAGDNKVHLNTISTPKGGQYQVVLSDGTRVWLNSASSITYPTAFEAKQRMVELTGEAYFEVARNEKSPFSVKTAVQTVEVLGTHFNINSYADEPLLKTTLLEGAVKVFTANDQAVLSAGQQARINHLQPGSRINVADHIDLDKVIAWKNGVFSFENEDLKSIMRQVSRWYNVNVVYTGPVSEEKFFGEISRNSNLSEVFKILEFNNVHFELQGKTIKVSANPQSPAK